MRLIHEQIHLFVLIHRTILLVQLDRNLVTIGEYVSSSSNKNQ